MVNFTVLVIITGCIGIFCMIGPALAWACDYRNRLLVKERAAANPLH